MADPRPRFVGIAHGRYAALPALPSACADTQGLAELLQHRHGYAVKVLADLPRGELLDAIDAHLAPGGAAGTALIVAWTGHGRIGADGSLRLMGTAGAQDVDVAQAGQLGEWAARTGARQVLVIIDTCYAGGGMADATRLALAVDAGRATPGATWFGVVAASQADEPSRAGALAGALRRLLDGGPRAPDFRWDRTRPWIRGDDLAQALLADWDEPRHTPHAMSLGRAWDLVRNPLHEEGVRDEPIEHLLQAARGGTGPVSFFTGREAALERLVAWLRRGRPGLFVLTGPPGCGKSAIAGRIVSLSAPEERRRLLAAEEVPAARDPGEASVDAQLQARGTTVETAAAELAGQLGMSAEEGLFGLLGAARARRLAGDPLLVVVDGLDEARAFSRDIVAELLQPLAREALVLVATRELALGNTTLLRELAREAELLDLGEDPAGTLHDLRRYVERRLEGVHATMDPARVAEAVGRQVEAASAAPFLLARLITSQLRDEPVDTGRDSWTLALATTVENALERDLRSVVLEIDGEPRPAAARELLAALALAFGAGFPADDVWPAVATATSRAGLRYDRDHVYRLIGALGRHILASREGDQPVYRIAHQALVDYLATEAARGAREPGMQALRTVVGSAVARVYEELLDAGLAPQEPAYLWRHAWRHLALAGTPGLEALERLVARDRAFRPDMGAALELAGSEAWAQARPQDSLALHERAIAIWRELGDRLRESMGLFQLAVARSSLGDDDGADAATAEAVEIARSLQDRPEGQAILAHALLMRAHAESREGSVWTAQRLSEEAVALAGAAARADEDARQLLAAAHAAASQAAAACGDFATAATHGERGVGLYDAIAPPGAVPLMGRLEALASLAFVRFLQAATAPPDGQGRRTGVDISAGERLLREYRRAGAGTAIGELVVAKGMAFLARGRWFNALFAPSADDRPAEILPLVDEAAALARPHAAGMVEAALALAAVLQLRATLVGASDPAAAEAASAEAAAVLRPFAQHSASIGGELGLVLMTGLQLRMERAVAMAQPFDPAQLATAQEAVAWLRPSPALTHRQALAQALGQLALLQGDSPERLDLVTRAEAIAVWRELSAVTAEAPPQLALQLIDQSARLLHGGRTAEAAEAGREALDIAAGLAPPHRGLMTGLAEVNLGAALVVLGSLDDAAAMLADAITRLGAFDAAPVISAALANAHLTLAQIELNTGRVATACDHARCSVALFDTPGIPPFAAANRVVAVLLLAQSLLAAGQAAEGQPLLQQTVDNLVQAARAGRSEGDWLVFALNTAAPELWDDVLAKLADRSELVERFRLLRRWPVEQIDRNAAALVEALAAAQGAATREAREIARQHRSTAPEAFDRAWQAATGEIPAWLRLESRLVQAVFAWWNTPNWALSERYLRSHDELLQPAVDEVLDELALDPEFERLAGLHRQIVDAARRGALEEAYAPLLIHEEIKAWLESHEPEQHLAQHEAALMRPEVLDELRRRAADGDAASATLEAVLELSHRGERTLAFEAIQKPGSLLDALQSGWRGADAARQRLLATIVRNAADDAASRARAAGTLLIAHAIETGDDKPDPALCAEVHGAPDGYDCFVASAAEAMVATKGAAATLGQLMAAVDAARPAAAGEELVAASARSKTSDMSSGPLEGIGEGD